MASGRAAQQRVDHGGDGDRVVHPPHDVQRRGIGLDGAGEPGSLLPALLYVADETGEQEMALVTHDLLHRGGEEILREPSGGSAAAG